MTLTQLHNLEEWMAALTSGRYKQGRGRLRSWLKQIQSPPVQTWTALGVAVQLFYTGPDLDQVIESQSDWTGLGVAELVGLDDVGTLPQSILVQKPMGDNTHSGVCTSIQCLNDRARYTLNQISDQVTRQIISPQKIVLG